MNIPLNWLKDYIKLPKDQTELTDKLTMVGHMLDKSTKSGNNTIIDLELRGNRADCYSILGIAKEVSAIFDKPLNLPKTKSGLKYSKSLKNVNLNVKTPLVKRVMMTVIKDVKIVASPTWLKNNLKEYGIDSVNNIVDLTNFVMIETGEPMHTFDFDRVGNDLSINLAKDGDKMVTFQGTTLTLTKEDLVWAKKGDILSVAGAIGSKKNSISDNTKNVLLEAASYDRANIRRSIHKHNLFTDAGIRHEKDLDPNLVKFAIDRFLYLIEENKWGTISNEVMDYYPKPVKEWEVGMDYDYLETITGIKIDPKVAVKILKRLGFTVITSTTRNVVVSVPTIRTDVTLEEDLIEEVIRIYGYDKINPQVLSLELPENITPDYIKQEMSIKEDMIALGFDETIGIPFVNASLSQLNKLIEKTKGKTLKVINRPSPDTEYLRANMIPSLFEATTKVENERGENARFFEIGKIYYQKGESYLEKRKLGVMYWEVNKNSFYDFKGLLDSIIYKLGIKDVTIDHESGLNVLSNQYIIKSGKDTVGYGGKIANKHFVEIDLDALEGKTNETSVKLWPKYPPQIEDITFELAGNTKVGEVLKEMERVKNVNRVHLTDIYKDSYTFRVWYQHKEKTLTNKDVEKIRQEIIKSVTSKFSANIK